MVHPAHRQGELPAHLFPVGHHPAVQLRHHMDECPHLLQVVRRLRRQVKKVRRADRTAPAEGPWTQKRRGKSLLSSRLFSAKIGHKSPLYAKSVWEASLYRRRVHRQDRQTGCLPSTQQLFSCPSPMHSAPTQTYTPFSSIETSLAQLNSAVKPGLLLRNPQHSVAHAHMGLDVLGVGGVLLNLLAQGCHEYPQGGGVAGEHVSPDLL